MEQRDENEKHDLPKITGQALNQLSLNISGKLTLKKLFMFSVERTNFSLTAYMHSKF